MLSVELAIEQMLSALAPVGLEHVPLLESLGRVSAHPIEATRPQPAFSNSAMDGYAVHSEDFSGDGPYSLHITAESKAGDRQPVQLAPGQAARIFTGAPMPEGADAVIVQEEVHDGTTVRRPLAGEFVRPQGEDIPAGECILRRGQAISPGEIANLAAQGVVEPVVFKQPRVALLSTGDELIPPGPEPKLGQTTNSSLPMLAAATQRSGAIPQIQPAVPDALDPIKAAMLEASEHADLLIVTGGMSVGDYDFAAVALRELGDVLFHRVRMKPGKPIAFGHIDQTPVLGLPGNPVSSFVGFELFGRPAIRTLAGFSQVRRAQITAELATAVTRNQNRVEYLRGFFRDDRFHPHARQGSGHLGSLLNVEGLAQIDPGDSVVPAGEVAHILDLRRD